MDDILVAARLEEVLHKVYIDLVKALEERGLFIALEKAQQKQVIDYLGASVQDQRIVSQKVELRVGNLKTLHDFQKLLGDINWIRCYLKLPNYVLKPLYDNLMGEAALDSPRSLTSEAQKALEAGERELAGAFLQYI